MVCWLSGSEEPSVPVTVSCDVMINDHLLFLSLHPAALHQHHQHRHPPGGHRPDGEDCGASRERPGEDSFHLQQPVSVQHDAEGEETRKHSYWSGPSGNELTF